MELLTNFMVFLGSKKSNKLCSAAATREDWDLQGQPTLNVWPPLPTSEFLPLVGS